MALKNLFDMAKADRYTADGREALIKAQEAETEDKVYQIGEISEKTGLQKTAQGWKPPKETKFGKVKQNKEGQWGVQTKQGKGSGFLKHKSEKEASRALANYTAGYNTTERSKQDPHSDYARQQKQWNKETDRMRKNSNAERRAEHASHFQESKPAEIDVKKLKEGQVLKNKEGTELKIDYIGPHAINYSVGGASFQATPSQMKAALEANGYTSTGSLESKPVEETKTGVPIQGSNWLSLPSGTRMTFEGAKEKMAKNNERIETIKKMMEGKSRAYNFRLGSELKSLQNENEYIAERLPPEKTENQTATSSLPEQSPEEIREIGRAAREWREGQKRDSRERQAEVQKALAEQMKKEANSSDIKIRGMDKNQYIFNTMMERHIPKEKAEESWNQEVERVNKLRAESNDAAPRVLTGDCRIRVRKA